MRQVIAFELMVGETPFLDEEENRMYQRIVDCDFAFPAKLKPSASGSRGAILVSRLSLTLSREAKDFVLALLKSNPGKAHTLLDHKT